MDAVRFSVEAETKKKKEAGMKKVLIALSLALALGTAAWAQTPDTPWTWQLQAGYNNSTKWLDSGWNGSTGVGYAFNNNFKLNFDVGYFQGKIKHSDIKSHIWTFMLAPEYVTSVTDNDQFYGFVGVGVARNDSKDYSTGLPAPLDTVKLPGQSKFAAEAGIGYRHFFNKNVGMSVQATYTHMAFKEKLDPVDARVGLVVRF
jgi:outer membrane protein W